MSGVASDFGVWHGAMDLAFNGRLDHNRRENLEE